MLKGHQSYIKTQKYTFQAFNEVGEGIAQLYIYEIQTQPMYIQHNFYCLEQSQGVVY